MQAWTHTDRYRTPDFFGKQPEDDNETTSVLSSQEVVTALVNSDLILMEVLYKAQQHNVGITLKWSLNFDQAVVESGVDTYQAVFTSTAT